MTGPPPPGAAASSAPAAPVRASGLLLIVGALSFIVHVVARSIVTAGQAPASFATGPLWAPICALGTLGAVLVVVGLPGAYAGTSGSITISRGELAGLALIVAAWMLFGVFLSLYSLLVLPWLAAQAPSLIAASAPPPAGLAIAFGAGLLAELAGAVMVSIPFVRGRRRPRWIGYALPLSVILTVIGDLVAPNGPAANVAVNLGSNVGPLVLMVALGAIGLEARRRPAA